MKNTQNFVSTKIKPNRKMHSKSIVFSNYITLPVIQIYSKHLIKIFLKKIIFYTITQTKQMKLS